MNETNRTRNLYIDMRDGEAGPRCGDCVCNPKSEYWVVRSHRVKRKSIYAPPRYQMVVIRAENIDPEFLAHLLRSAERHGGSAKFSFKWYPRKKRSFENYIRRQA